MKWHRWWWHKYTKQGSLLAFSDIDRNQSLGLSPRSPCAGVAAGLIKKKREHSIKNRQKWHSVNTCLNTFKITTYPHLGHRSNMTGYSFYNCIRYQNAKTRLRICGNWHVFCKDANSVANAEIKTQLKLICQTFLITYKIQQNFTI